MELPKLPLLGQIAAGGPLLAEQNVEDEIAVPETLRGDFLLRVKGDSMIEAGILEGDLVIVRRAQDARNGDIVVALAGDDESADEATVKTFYRESGRVRLQPENAALEPIYAQHVADPRQGRGGVPGAMKTASPRCTGHSSRSCSRCCAAPRSSARRAESSSCTSRARCAVRSAGSSCAAGSSRRSSR